MEKCNRDAHELLLEPKIRKENALTTETDKRTFRLTTFITLSTTRFYFLKVKTWIS